MLCGMGEVRIPAVGLIVGGFFLHPIGQPKRFSLNKSSIVNSKKSSISGESNDMAPEYLCELVSIRKSSRKLGSSSQILLQVPVSRLKSYGDCAFSVAAPQFVE